MNHPDESSIQKATKQHIQGFSASEAIVSVDSATKLRHQEIGELFEEYASLAWQIMLDGAHPAERYQLMGAIERGEVLPEGELAAYQRIMAEHAQRKARRKEILARFEELIPGFTFQSNSGALKFGGKLD